MFTSAFSPSPRLRMAGLLLAGALAVLPGWSAAQNTYPSRTVTFVVPFEVGGAADQVGRIWADYLGKQLGVAVVVNNKTGANGSVAAAYVSKMPADGYTLLMTSSSISLNPFTYKTLPYKDSDFDGVALIGTTPQILVTSPATGIKTVDDLVRRARAKPNEISYGSAGLGNSTHLNVDTLARFYGIQLNHIPYKGSASAMMATIGGQTQLVADTVMNVLNQQRGGKIVPLVIFGPQRIAELPGVPTVQELGIKDSINGGWYGVLAPAGTPKAVIERLNAATNAMWKDPAAKAQLDTVQFIPMPDNGVGAVKAYAAHSAKTWGPILTQLGIRNE